MRKMTLVQAFACLLLALVYSGSLSAQLGEGEKENLALRFIFPNFVTPLGVIPPNLVEREHYGFGMEFEYQRRLAPNFLLGVPLRIAAADAIRNTSVNLLNPIDLERDLRNVGIFGLDGLVMFEPIARRSVIDPQLFVGIGVNTESFDKVNLELPLGINLNIRLGEAFYLHPHAAYRIALGDDTGLRDNFTLGAGVLVNLGPEAPKLPPPPPPVLDADGDGVPDVTDQCPNDPGPVATLGCPDTDGDGIADKDDKCPELPGTSVYMGCPDTDGDGLPDNEDDCPNEAGPQTNQGCPLADQDGDGVPDARDKCPSTPGSIALDGCPDDDGDGVANAQDRCPNEPGTLVNQGCPDTDSDTVVDPDDRCPTEFGPATNKGCPEISQEDKEVIDFAIQNINFETGSINLTASSRQVLDRVKDIMERYAAYSLAIGGHTDGVGSTESNQRLSERRASAVREYLVGAGISPDRMTAQGFGESMPIATNDTAAGREENRRVALDLTVN